MMIYYIDNFKQSMWPKGKLAPYPPPRTDLVSCWYLHDSSCQALAKIITWWNYLSKFTATI